jgi:HlyD family secretion protein
MPKKARIVLAALALTLLTSLLAWFFWPQRFRYSGTVEAEEIDLSPGVASPIAAYRVAEGDAVKKGQVLVELDCRDIRLAARLAADEFRRAESLFKGGTLSRQAFDKVQFSRDDSAVKASWCTVEAPGDGTVLQTYQSAGEWARPGGRLLTVADLAHPYAFIYVEQGLLARIRLGQAVTGHLPEIKDKAFAGKVSFIREKAEFTPKNVQTRDERARLVFGVKVSFENKDGELKPGMPIEVDLGF